MAAYDQFDVLALHLPLEAVMSVFPATDTAQMAQTAMHAPGNPERIILRPLDLGGISAHRFTSESYKCKLLFPESRCQHADDKRYKGNNKEDQDGVTKVVWVGS